MKKIFFTLVCIFITLGLSPQLHANIFTKQKVDGITLQYVTYDTSSAIYNLKVSVSPDENVRSLRQLMEQENAVTGINGIFFCPADYTACDGKNYTINERFVKWVDTSFYEDTGDRVVFGWTAEMEPLVFQTGKINQNRREDIYEWMGNFPLFLYEGNSRLEYYHDVGLYDSKMKNPKIRHYICSNASGTEIIFWKSSLTSLDNLAPALAKIGCYNALNLDAGGSSQFVYNGRGLDYASRNILDSFVIEHSQVDVAELHTLIDRLMTEQISQLKYISKTKSLPYINSILTEIPKIRNDIYVENSFDLYDETGNIVGYEAELSTVELTKRVYLLNMLERAFQQLKKDIQDR